MLSPRTPERRGLGLMPVKPSLEREPWRAVYDDPRWPMTLREARIRDGGQCRALLKNGMRCPEVCGLEGHHRIPLRDLWARGDEARAFDSRFVIMLCTAHHRQAVAARRSSP
jgi:hypothetical protein